MLKDPLQSCVFYCSAFALSEKIKWEETDIWHSYDDTGVCVMLAVLSVQKKGAAEPVPFKETLS